MLNNNKETILFTEYLQAKHIEKYPQVLDDDLPDHFDNWVVELDPAQLIEWGDIAMEKQAKNYANSQNN